MYKLKSSKSVYKSQWMEVCEDSVTDEEQGTVGMFNRINVDDAATIVPIEKHVALHNLAIFYISNISAPRLPN